MKYWLYEHGAKSGSNFDPHNDCSFVYSDTFNFSPFPKNTVPGVFRLVILSAKIRAENYSTATWTTTKTNKWCVRQQMQLVNKAENHKKIRVLIIFVQGSDEKITFTQQIQLQLRIVSPFATDCYIRSPAVLSGVFHPVFCRSDQRACMKWKMCSPQRLETVTYSSNN